MNVSDPKLGLPIRYTEHLYQLIQYSLHLTDRTTAIDSIHSIKRLRQLLECCQKYKFSFSVLLFRFDTWLTGSGLSDYAHPKV